MREVRQSWCELITLGEATYIKRGKYITWLNFLAAVSKIFCLQQSLIFLRQEQVKSKKLEESMRKLGNANVLLYLWSTDADVSWISLTVLKAAIVSYADEEMRRTDELLYQMIPKQIADRLRAGSSALDTCQVSHRHTYTLRTILALQIN